MMDTQPSKANRWIGLWLMGVATIHCAFGVIMFGEVLAAIVRRGVFNTVGSDPMTGAVVWFMLFGAALFICGQTILQLEQAGQPVRAAVGWSLLLLVVLGVVLMPVSGFWLALPPALALLRRAKLGVTPAI